MKLTKQFFREAEEIKVKELFHSYNASHMEERHVYVTDNDLRQRVLHTPSDPIIPIRYSRFDCELDKILSMIYDCILDDYSLRQIEKWNPEKASLTLTLSFDHPIGHGIVDSTNWYKSFAMSDICVVLGDSTKKGRLFSIITAYPIANMEEEDLIDEAVAEYKTHVSQKRTGKN